MAIMMILEEVDMSTLVSRIQKNAGVEMLLLLRKLRKLTATGDAVAIKVSFVEEPAGIMCTVEKVSKI